MENETGADPHRGIGKSHHGDGGQRGEQGPENKDREPASKGCEETARKGVPWAKAGPHVRHPSWKIQFQGHGVGAGGTWGTREGLGTGGLGDRGRG